MKQLSSLLSSFLLAALLLAGAYLIPWNNISWGKIEMMPGSTVTVTGRAKSSQSNEVASFTAGVSAINQDKQAAMAEVNQKTEEIISAVKQFGIPTEDIQTQNLSVYQRQENYNGGEAGDWHTNNTVSIKLREADRASALTEVLAQTGATNIHGPNFRIEDTSQKENDLLSSAIDDAREKAELIAQASDKQLGKVITVNEGGSSAPRFGVMSEMGAGGGAPVEPGTSTVSKTVTVVFELK